MILKEAVDIAELPQARFASVAEWVETIADDLWMWDGLGTFVEDHAGEMCERPDLPALPEQGVGWFRLNQNGKWEQITQLEIPPAVTLDVEAFQRKGSGLYYPALAVAWGAGSWFAWQRDHRLSEPEMVIPFNPETVVVGHNIAAHDSKYLSCEYHNPYGESAITPAKNVYVDTMCLAQMVRGLSNDSMEGFYEKCKQAIASGHSAPQWYEHAWTVSLQELGKRLLGIQLAKEVRSELEAWNLETYYDRIAGKDLLNYCALDVWVAHQLFQKLFAIVDKQFFSSRVSWLGMFEMARCKIYLKDWDGFLQRCEAEYETTMKEVSDLIRDLAVEATEEQFPDWDWSKLGRGPFKGVPKCRQKLEIGGYSVGSRMAIELLRLHWEGDAIEWQQLNSRSGQWIKSGSREPLPHPDGNERLSSPLCKGYRMFVESGRLTSAVLEQEGLLELFAAVERCAQWVIYRSRYHNVYRPYEDENGLDVVKPEINPCGTITRRATSPLWMVTPKEREGTIGSDVQNYIVAPEGYSIVYADFDQQESWLMSLLTDAQAGQIASNAWSKAVLYGDKNLGTDTHSMVANDLKIPRKVAKKLNFESAYGAGVITIANTIWGALNCAFEQAEIQAKNFINYLRGKDGVARATFATLKKLATTAHIRTAILGCKIPDSINAAWCGTEFMTTRQNWQIQSAGTDCLHTLIVLCKAFFLERNIEAYLMLHRHDAVYWIVPEGRTAEAQEVLQIAHYWVKRLAYEQAVDHAHGMKQREGFAGKAPTLEPPEVTLWFSGVEVGKNAGEF